MWVDGVVKLFMYHREKIVFGWKQFKFHLNKLMGVHVMLNQIIPAQKDFPTLSKTNSVTIPAEKTDLRREFRAFVCLAVGTLSWSQVAREIAAKLKWNRHLDLQVLDDTSASFQPMNNVEWESCWKPMIWNCRGTQIEIKRWAKVDELIPNNRTEQIQNWILIQGLPIRLWTRENFKKIGDKLGGLTEIDGSIANKDPTCCRIGIQCIILQIPASVQVEIEKQNLILAISWDWKFSAEKPKIAMQYRKVSAGLEKRKEKRSEQALLNNGWNCRKHENSESISNSGMVYHSSSIRVSNPIKRIFENFGNKKKLDMGQKPIPRSTQDNFNRFKGKKKWIENGLWMEKVPMCPTGGIESAFLIEKESTIAVSDKEPLVDSQISDHRAVGVPRLEGNQNPNESEMSQHREDDIIMNTTIELVGELEVEIEKNHVEQGSLENSIIDILIPQQKMEIFNAEEESYKGKGNEIGTISKADVDKRRNIRNRVELLMDATHNMGITVGKYEEATRKLYASIVERHLRFKRTQADVEKVVSCNEKSMVETTSEEDDEGKKIGEINWGIPDQNGY